MRLILLAAAAAAMVACSSSTPASTPSPNPTLDPPTATATRVDPTATPEPPDTPVPTATPTVDAATAFEVWKVVFWATYGPTFSDTLPAAFEEQFYWIESIDRVTYDGEVNELVIDATVAFEGTYLRNPQEWRDDTWDFYRTYSREIWNALITGIEQSDGFTAHDWPRWTPHLILTANTGRLSVSCPGATIYAIRERQAVQTEFQAQCAFSH